MRSSNNAIELLERKEFQGLRVGQTLLYYVKIKGIKQGA